MIDVIRADYLLSFLLWTSKQLRSSLSVMPTRIS